MVVECIVSRSQAAIGTYKHLDNRVINKELRILKYNYEIKSFYMIGLSTNGNSFHDRITDKCIL